MSTDLHKARWVGPYPAQLGPQTTLEHGDEWEVSEDDLKSSHWEAIGKAKAVEKQALESDAPADVADEAGD